MPGMIHPRHWAWLLGTGFIDARQWLFKGGSMPVDQEVIESLLRELAKYEARGDDDNVRGVKNELARLGFKPAAPAKRAETRPAAVTKKETR